MRSVERRTIPRANAASTANPVAAERKFCTPSLGRGRAHQRQELGKNANPGEINEAGYFTAACGITVYRGNAYPPSYRGNLFIAEPAGNLVHRRAIDPEGVSFVSRRVDEKADR